MEYYRLGNPAVSSIGADGVTHFVNAAGLLEVNVRTPGLEEALRHHAAKPMGDTPGAVQTGAATVAAAGPSEADAVEREVLFGKLEMLIGRKVDRRRSLQQLRAAYQTALEERIVVLESLLAERPDTGDKPEKKGTGENTGSQG